MSNHPVILITKLWEPNRIRVLAPAMLQKPNYKGDLVDLTLFGLQIDAQPYLKPQTEIISLRQPGKSLLLPEVW